MGSAAIFNGPYVKLLKDNLKFKDAARILTGDFDPRAVPTEAEPGSLFLRYTPGFGAVYFKKDNGTTTNWDILITQEPLEFLQVSSPNLTIQGGFIFIDDGREVGTPNGGDLVVNLTTILGTSPAPNTSYYLYVDLTTLTTSSILAPAGRVYYPMNASNMELTTATPQYRNARRYLPLGVIATNGSGTWTSFSNLAVRTHDSRLIEASTITFSQQKTLIKTIGDEGQLAGGHVLTADSFPFSLSNQVAILSLSTNGDDSSGNAKHVSSSSVVFSGAGLFGTDKAARFTGTSATATSSNPFYNPGNTPIAFGAWVAMANWAWGSGADFNICTVGSAGDLGFRLAVTNSGNIVAQATNSNSSYQATATATAPGFAADSWHHLAFRFTPGSKIEIFIDGALAAQATLNTQRTVSTSLLTLGTTGAFAGTARMREFFFAKTSPLEIEDLRKIKAAKIQHNQYIPPENQLWSATYWRGDNKIVNEFELSSWLVDKSSANAVYVDFSQLLSTEYVSFWMQQLNFNAYSVPKTFVDTGFITSLADLNLNHPNAANFAMNHGLPSAPTYFMLQYETTPNTYDSLIVSNYLSCTSTQIVGDLSTLTIGPNNKIRIFAAAGADPVGAIGIADEGRSGVVTNTAQAFGGNKYFANDVTVIGNLKTTVSEKLGSYTARDGDDLLVDTTSGTYTIALPPNPAIGAKVIIRDGAGTFATNNLTIARNGHRIQGQETDIAGSVNGEKLEFVYYNATQGWRVFTSGYGSFLGGPATPAVPVTNLYDSLQSLAAYLAGFMSEFRNPNFYYYGLDGDATTINDGGGDMYDGGNWTYPWLISGADYSPGGGTYISSNVLSYSNTIATTVDSSFRYCSLGYVQGAGINTPSTPEVRPLTLLGSRNVIGQPVGFQKSGNSGADGGGTLASGYVYNGSNINGFTVYAWMRQTYNAGDPSHCDLYILLGHSSWNSTFGTISAYADPVSNGGNGGYLYTSGAGVKNILAITTLLSKNSGVQVTTAECQTVVQNYVSRIRTYYGF